MRLLWLAHDEVPAPYITIPKYWFNKTINTHTSIALTLANLGTELLQLPAQCLIGSPGTLAPRAW